MGLSGKPGVMVFAVLVSAVSATALTVDGSDGLNASEFELGSESGTDLKQEIERRIANESREKVDIKKQIRQRMREKTRELRHRQPETRGKGFLSSLFSALFG